MTKPSVRFSLGRYLILLAGIQFFFSGCAQLDGVFPKFKPQKTTKKSTSTSSAETVTEQQEFLTEENRLLKAKIDSWHSKSVNSKNSKKYRVMIFYCFRNNGKLILFCLSVLLRNH